MNKDEIKKALSNFEVAVNEEKAEINIMLVEQNNQRKKRYKGIMLKIKQVDIKSMISKSIEKINNDLFEKSIDSYDLEISLDDSIQTVERRNVIYGEEILGEISIDYNNENTVNANTDLSRIKFAVVQILYNDKSLYLFQHYVQPSTAYKTSEKYVFSGGVLRPFTETIITLNCLVDAFLFDDTYYILNRNSFNSIFAYKDVFKKILDENAISIKESGLLTDSTQFIKDCESNGHHITRLTKAILADGFKEVAKKKDSIPKIVKDFKLSLTLSEEGEIAYKGKEDIPEILNLLLRHYVIDALTSNKMIATAIQSYKA